jgi:hypothetical protein
MGVTISDLATPDATTAFDHGHVDVANVGEFTIRRNTFEPGWRWSTSVKPMAETDSCQVHHVGYVVSGQLHVATEDGADAEIGPGAAYEILPGHDGWVVGDEPVISIEFAVA